MTCKNNMICQKNICCQNNILSSWGRNDFAQLGVGFSSSPITTPVKVITGVTGLFNPIAIAGGFQHSLAIDCSGQVWAWGRNNFGQLGDGTNTNSTLPIRVSKLTGLTNPIAIAAGRDHSLAIDCSGQVWAWGRNNFGQLGDGTNTNRTSPVQVSGLTNIIAIDAGRDHSLAIDYNGQAWAWGRNNFGQLGDGTTTNSNTPVQVTGITGLSNVIAINGGANHSLAIDCLNEAWAWGHNNEGQLGDGTTTDSSTPVQVDTGTGLTNVIAIAAGGQGGAGANSRDHSLAIDSSGQAWAWGSNIFGQLGSPGPDSSTPRQVSGVTGLANVIAIAAGRVHSLAIDSDGQVWVWGRNNFGQLAIGTTGGFSNIPIDVSEGT